MKTYPLNKDCSNGRCERNTYVVCKVEPDLLYPGEKSLVELLSLHLHITKGSKYEVFDNYLDSYLIRNDEGDMVWCNTNVIMTLDEWREEQLKELGID